MEIETILSLAPYMLMLLIGAGGSYYVIFKGKLSKFRKLIDSIDDAVYDDAVTEAEFRKIYEDAKVLVEK